MNRLAGGARLPMKYAGQATDDTQHVRGEMVSETNEMILQLALAEQLSDETP